MLITLDRFNCKSRRSARDWNRTWRVAVGSPGRQVERVSGMGPSLSEAREPNHFRCNPARRSARLSRQSSPRSVCAQACATPLASAAANPPPDRATPPPGRSREWRPAPSQLPRTLWATRLSRVAAAGALLTPPASSTPGFRCR
ncbi:unnamed protein product, partial [Iphiclides podalirius]